MDIKKITEIVNTDLLTTDAKGRAIKNMNFECGIFCEITN